MADEEHLAKLNEGPVAWSEWRRANPTVVPDLSGHDFAGFDFGGMDLTNAIFRHADLTDAKLDSVTGLLPGNLAGVDLTRADLPPEVRDFPGLDQVAEVSKHARVNFLAVIASCVFCWLAIAQTTDAELLVSKGQLTLPVIETKVPDRGFFLFAPLILLALYVYLHLYLQRMWDGLSRLPAVFPDGARLDQKAFPWLLSGLVTLYVPRLRRGAPPFAGLQVALSIVFAWLVAPLTIAWFWSRYLLVTDMTGLWLHVPLLGAAVGFGVLFYLRAHTTLLGREAVRGANGGVRRWLRWSVSPAVLLAFWAVAHATTVGVREHLGPWVYLDLRSAPDTGAAPETETKDRDGFAGLDLSRAHFRHAKADGAALPGVRLSGDLSSASFVDADLSGARLSKADLAEANLSGANLDGTQFLEDVRLDGTDLANANNLTQPNLAGACGVPASLPAGLEVSPCESDAGGGRPVSIGSGPGQGTSKRPLGTPAEPRRWPKDCAECPEMIVVPAGDFFMGSPEDEADRISTEGPLHAVGIAVDFAVGRTEVTRREFAAFAAETGRDLSACWVFSGGGWKTDETKSWQDPGFVQAEDHPATCVSWDDAKAYIAWLNEKVDGGPYRFLTESEWEYVARAGTTTAYWWGGEASHEYANYGAEECCEGLASGRDRWVNTAPVGSFEPNAFGLLDTAGNVWEWVEDCWNDSYEDAPVDGSAWTEGQCRSRVLRGGAWFITPRFLRAAARDGNDTGNRISGIGFRVARTLDR